jgi:hypothetical protein
MLQLGAIGINQPASQPAKPISEQQTETKQFNSDCNASDLTGKRSVQISVGTPTILNEVFRGFPQNLYPL